MILYYQNTIKSQFLDFEFHEKIIEQMENNICKIKLGKHDITGTGFFCKIPFPDKDKMLKVLMTNNHVIPDNILYYHDEEIIILTNDYNYFRLKLNNRIKYTSKVFDTTIIEIKEEDGIDNYLELDDKILNDIINNKNEIGEYEANAIYMLQYPDHRLLVSYGMLEKIYENEKNKFAHNCNSYIGSSGSPIFNLNNKVIAIHIGAKKINKNEFGIGIFINYPIKELIQQQFYNKENINEIIIKGNDKEKNLSSKDFLMKKFGLIYKCLGKELFNELNEFDLLFRNKFKSNYFYTRTGIFELNICKRMLYIMVKSICKINIENKQAIGFFCKIPIPKQNNMLRVLITNNYVLNEEILNKKDGKISIKIKNENNIKEINLNDRKKYTSKEYNTTMIEIKEDDGINNNYLELDHMIIQTIMNEQNEIKSRYVQEYKDQIIYMINNQLGILTISHVKINTFEKTMFLAECNTKDISLGVPIISYYNKLIGIYFDKRKVYKNIFISHH